MQEKISKSVAAKKKQECPVNGKFLTECLI